MYKEEGLELKILKDSDTLLDMTIHVYNILNM